MDRRQSAFTLIELLVVIAVIAILASITLFIAIRVRMNARAAFCTNNMRQIGMALAMRAEQGISRDWTHVGKHLEPDDSILLCPQGPQDGQTNYAVNARLVGRAAYVSDTGATVLLYESKRAGTGLIGDARDVDLRHSDTATFVFLDGHAKRMKEIPPFGP